MIGSKKLGTIRKQLRDAFSTNGTDPIRWLEERMTGPGVKQDEVLQALLRIIHEETAKKKNKRRRSGAKAK